MGVVDHSRWSVGRVRQVRWKVGLLCSGLDGTTLGCKVWCKWLCFMLQVVNRVLVYFPETCCIHLDAEID